MAEDSRRYCRLLYVPEGSATDPTANSYSRQMVQAFEKIGISIVSGRLGSPSGLLHGWRERRRTVALVNWLENHLVGAAGRLSVGGLLTYLRKLAKLRLLAATVLYVEHNRYPHHTHPRARTAVRRTMQWATWLLCDRVIVHDADPLDHRHAYLPHPVYPVHPQGLEPALERHVVCFGRIAPYKALEALIDRWSGDWTLLIAGAVRDRDYLRRLQSRAAGKNIVFRTEGLANDAAAAELVAACAAALVVHHAPSMIVSGSLYFALSCGVPVVSVGLAHARRLAEAGEPGVHFIGSLDELQSLDWHAIARTDRHAVFAHTQQRCSVDTVARGLAAMLGTQPP